MMPWPGTQALVVSHADKIVISASFASLLVRKTFSLLVTNDILRFVLVFIDYIVHVIRNNITGVPIA